MILGEDNLGFFITFGFFLDRLSLSIFSGVFFFTSEFPLDLFGVGEKAFLDLLVSFTFSILMSLLNDVLSYGVSCSIDKILASGIFI